MPRPIPISSMTLARRHEPQAIWWHRLQMALAVHRPQPKYPDLPRRSGDAVRVIAGVEVNGLSPGRSAFTPLSVVRLDTAGAAPCTRSCIPGEPSGSHSTPGALAAHSWTRSPTDHQSLRSKSADACAAAGLGTGRRHQSCPVQPGDAHTAVGPRDQHLIDSRRNMKRELHTDWTHCDALHHGFTEASAAGRGSDFHVERTQADDTPKEHY